MTVNPSETADLLTAMSAFDRRTIGDGDVIAWQAVLSDASFGDCLEAVRRHYAEHTEWMMPAHVRRIVRDIHGEREASARDTGWAPGQAGVPKGQAMPELKTGEISQPDGLSPRIMAMLAEIRASLPEGALLALKPREAYWAKEHAAYLRSQNAEPNPHYRPNRIISCGCGPEHAPGCSHAVEG